MTLDIEIDFRAIGWRFERFREECRKGRTVNTTYVTIGFFHIFFSRPAVKARA